MALTISLANTSTEDQSVTLFDNGGANSNNFITLNQSSVAQSQFISAPSGNPSTQQVFQAGKFYYQSVFNSSGYYYGSLFTTLGFTATINGVSRNYVFAITSIANRTFTDIQTLLTNSLRTAAIDPRPNAQVILNATNENGVQYLSVNVLDNVDSNESVVYNTCRLYCDTVDIGSTSVNDNSIFFDQIYTTAITNNTFLISSYPSVQFADSNGWFTFQGNNLTLPSEVFFRIYDSYFQSIPFSSGYSYWVEFQLTETISTGNFELLNTGGSSIATISGSSLNSQAFAATPNSTGSFRLTTTQPITSWNGQIRMRITPRFGAQAPKFTPGQSILNQIGSGGGFIPSNPNVITPAPISGVGLQEIINSTAGNVYKVTSIYIFSTNPNQVTAPITFAKKDANGNLIQTDLDVVIDPNAPQSVAYRTNAMEGFIIDSSAVINLTIKAESSVNIKMEYEVLSYDEIREQAIASDLDLAGIEKQKEILDLEYGTPGSDLDDFYTLQ